MNNEIVEQWNIGILENWVILLSVAFILPIVPSFHPSNTPDLSLIYSHSIVLGGLELIS
jgi:hypothetical protein